MLCQFHPFYLATLAHSAWLQLAVGEFQVADFCSVLFCITKTVRQKISKVSFFKLLAGLKRFT
jgi:hypothetical protein